MRYACGEQYLVNNKLFFGDQDSYRRKLASAFPCAHKSLKTGVHFSIILIGNHVRKMLPLREILPYSLKLVPSKRIY